MSVAVVHRHETKSSITREPVVLVFTRRRHGAVIVRAVRPQMEYVCAHHEAQALDHKHWWVCVLADEARMLPATMAYEIDKGLRQFVHREQWLNGGEE